MKKIIIIGLVGVILILFSLSCEKIEVQSNIRGAVTLESIPLEYGSLVSVTTDTNYPNWAQLWFAGEDGIVKMVRVNWAQNIMMEKTLEIPRN